MSVQAITNISDESPCSEPPGHTPIARMADLALLAAGHVRRSSMDPSMRHSRFGSSVLPAAVLAAGIARSRSDLRTVASAIHSTSLFFSTEPAGLSAVAELASMRRRIERRDDGWVNSLGTGTYATRSPRVVASTTSSLSRSAIAPVVPSSCPISPRPGAVATSPSGCGPETGPGHGVTSPASSDSSVRISSTTGRSASTRRTTRDCGGSARWAQRKQPRPVPHPNGKIRRIKAVPRGRTIPAWFSTGPSAWTGQAAAQSSRRRARRQSG
jgi:hypothetical protein